MAYENGIQWIWVRKEIKAPTFIMRSLPSKEMGDIGSIKKKWVMNTPKNEGKWWVW